MSTIIIYLLGPLLASWAFVVFGKGMLMRSKGKSFNPLSAFIFLLAAFVFRFLIPGNWIVNAYDFTGQHAGMLDRICLMLTDIGVGMIAASLYLMYHRMQAIIFWVPGILALLFASGIYGFTLLIRNIQNFHKENSPSRIEFLLELGPDDHIVEVEAILKKYKVHYWQAFPNVTLDEDEDLAQYYVLCVDTTYQTLLYNALSYDRENVDHIEINHDVELIEPIPSNYNPQRQSGNYLADDPLIPNQWYVDRLNYNEAFKLLKSRKPVEKAKLAIVDTGVEEKHEDIKKVFRSSPGNSDKHSHGTHCAGIAGATTNNGKGIGSLNWEGEYISIAGYRALDRYGRGSDETVAQAIIDATEDGADVISMSLGGFHPRPPRVQVEAIEYALSNGSIVVVAAGNSNDDARKYSPANIDGVIVVSAVDESLNKAVFSNWNNELKMPIAAPGVNIFSTIPGNKYQSFNGTSMATPMVAGLVAVMRSFQPDLTPQQTHRILVNTGEQSRDTDRVGKVIMPSRALQAVQILP